MSEAALPAELLQQIKAIQIRTQRLVTEAVAGAYESAVRGRGMEFEEVREYRPGDDVRRIDWNVTARTGGAFVKEHREERELTVMLLCDLSASGAFGSWHKSKNEIAAEVAAVLAYSAIKSHDKVGLVVFSDRIEHVIPPRKGRGHLWRVIREILTYQPRGRGTDLTLALDYLARAMRRRVVGFLISDFLVAPESGWVDALARVARRHELTAVSLHDPRERALPNVGLVELEDLESGERVLVDSGDARLQAAFRATAEKHEAALADGCLRAGVGRIALDVSKPYVDPIVRYFRER